MSNQYDDLSPGSPTNVLDHPDHNHSDMQRLAGDVVPLQITPSFENQSMTAGKPPLAEVAEGQKQIRSGGSNVINHPSREQWQSKIKQRM